MIREHQSYLEERASAGDDEGLHRAGGDTSFLTSLEAARGLQELRALLNPAAIEEARNRALAEVEKEGEEQLQSYYHPVSGQQQQQEEAPPLPPRSAGGDQEQALAGEAAGLMAAVTDLLRERGMGILIGELSPLLASRYGYGKGRSWGEVWESAHG
jgi:hypothetical protein